MFTPAYCVCRKSRAEALGFHRCYAEEHADWDAVDNLMTLQGLHAQSFTPEMLEMFRGRFAAGHGVGPLVGTPDEVAAEIERFAQAGFGGMTLSFVDYVSELEFFVAEVVAAAGAARGAPAAVRGLSPDPPIGWVGEREIWAAVC